MSTRERISVADISAEALAHTRARLGHAADSGPVLRRQHDEEVARWSAGVLSGRAAPEYLASSLNRERCSTPPDAEKPLCRSSASTGSPYTSTSVSNPP